MNEVKLLLVDDVNLFLDLEKSFLSRESFTVFTAKSGEDALEAIETVEPDLVLVDLFMPGLNGDEVCRLIRENPKTRNIPVIITCSDTIEGVRERCYAAGCNGFVSKPIHRDTLLATIEENLKVAKRRFKRVPVSVACTMGIDDRTTGCLITSIAQAGAFIAISPAPGKGKSIELAFEVPDSGPTVSTRAIVRWTSPAREGSPEGVGVEFVTLSEEDEKRLKGFIDPALHEERI